MTLPPASSWQPRGRGSSCAGGDLKDYRELTDRESAFTVSMRMHDLLGRLRALPALVVCAIEGAAIGGGTELALACDLRIAGANATVAMPQSRLGVTLGWGTAPWLLEAVGRGRAVELLMTGRTVDAKEAAALGLVNAVVPAGQAESAARERIGQVAAASPSAVGAVKRCSPPRPAQQTWPGSSPSCGLATTIAPPRRPGESGRGEGSSDQSSSDQGSAAERPRAGRRHPG
ncbi:MAG TPA: enoyl-CoA hydratase/isomerase family protein [Dermatophilaceae bacterium]